MSTHTCKINLGNVDVSKLETEDDFRHEAQRIMPTALVQTGKAVGKTAWNELQKSLRGVTGLKTNTSTSDKDKFIREAGQNYLKNATAKERLELENYIVEHLKEMKQGSRKGDITEFSKLDKR